MTKSIPHRRMFHIETFVSIPDKPKFQFGGSSFSAECATVAECPPSRPVATVASNSVSPGGVSVLYPRGENDPSVTLDYPLGESFSIITPDLARSA
jgi:hypothetical protein